MWANVPLLSRERYGSLLDIPGTSDLLEKEMSILLRQEHVRSRPRSDPGSNLTRQNPSRSASDNQTVKARKEKSMLTASIKTFWMGGVHKPLLILA